MNDTTASRLIDRMRLITRNQIIANFREDVNNLGGGSAIMIARPKLRQLGYDAKETNQLLSEALTYDPIPD